MLNLLHLLLLHALPYISELILVAFLWYKFLWYLIRFTFWNCVSTCVYHRWLVRTFARWTIISLCDIFNQSLLYTRYKIDKRRDPNCEYRNSSLREESLLWDVGRYLPGRSRRSRTLFVPAEPPLCVARLSGTRDNSVLRHNGVAENRLRFCRAFRAFETSDRWCWLIKCPLCARAPH